MPNNIEDYIHRIGRTGRAGAKGIAVSFFTDKSSKLAHELIGILREARQIIPPELQQMASSNPQGGGSMRKYSSGGGSTHGGFNSSSQGSSGSRW